MPACPALLRLLSGSCSSARSFAPRFLHAGLTERRSAVCFARCDQLAGGLPPPSRCPCWAHMQKKDRLAAVSPKSDQVFRSGGCECGGALPLPALAQEKGPSMTPGPIAILEVASSGPSAVPQSGTN